jgi:hypothetical protein
VPHAAHFAACVRYHSDFSCLFKERALVGLSGLRIVLMHMRAQAVRSDAIKHTKGFDFGPASYLTGRYAFAFEPGHGVDAETSSVTICRYPDVVPNKVRTGTFSGKPLSWPCAAAHETSACARASSIFPS